MSSEMHTLTHATERDVDLIIIEEMKCSKDFVEWFVARILGRDECHSIESFDVLHSKRRIYTRREIDITLNISDGNQNIMFLIENKLDTDPQFNQAESYKEEAAVRLGQGMDVVKTVLVCPRSYVDSRTLFAEKFDCVFTYEEIHANFVRRSALAVGELSLRLSYKAELVRQAITKARRGYEAVPLPAIGQFAGKYVNLLRKNGIDLPPGPSMLKTDSPGESKTMIFAPSALPSWSFLPQTRLVHQLREANSNICFYTWGMFFNDLASFMAADLAGTSYRLVPTINKRAAGRSGLMIVAATPAVDNLASFDDQTEAIEEGQRITLSLRNWFSSRQVEVERWARRVAEIKSSSSRV